MPEGTDLIIKTPDAIEAKKIVNSRLELMKQILTDDDVQNIQGRDFKKKSFWRKLSGVFGVSVEIIKEWREDCQEDGSFTYYFVVRAIAPNGQFVEGTGACSSDERGLEKTIHNTRAIAETRAKNRAISDMLAFGEVSAEEIIDSQPPKTSGSAQSRSSTPREGQKGGKTASNQGDEDKKKMLYLDLKTALEHLPEIAGEFMNRLGNKATNWAALSLEQATALHKEFMDKANAAAGPEAPEDFYSDPK